MANPEEFVSSGDAEICTQSFGVPGDPAILLIHGASASMLWWDEELCERLAGRHRFVIRYDNLDTGRSSADPPGKPSYALTDLADDAIAILDHFGVTGAHVVGHSMGVATSLVLALDHRPRVQSLTFVAGTTGADDLPPMSRAFVEHVASPPDAGDPAAVEHYIVGLMRVFAGASALFDEGRIRDLVRQDIARTRDMAATLANPFLVELNGPKSGGLEQVTVPTLVVHGELDPVFPLAHGLALRDAVPGAKFLCLEGAGHDIPRERWDVFIDALIAHTGAASGRP
jgi:pimeloyl-ACP methyl ester carboxylesterase